VHFLFTPSDLAFCFIKPDREKLRIIQESVYAVASFSSFSCYYYTDFNAPFVDRLK